MPVHLGVQQHDDDKVSILICRLFEQNKYKYVVYYVNILVYFIAKYFQPKSVRMD